MCIMKYYLDVEISVKEYFVNYVERCFYFKVKKYFLIGIYFDKFIIVVVICRN